MVEMKGDKEIYWGNEYKKKNERLEMKIENEN